ncbi:MAG: hypothetical protein M1820_005819 [Bogoriella megaspora]|nr:MAG: hypothetical protein M1820_005819 [Bogoriella megaspora]
MGLTRTLYIGAFAHSTSPQDLDICARGAIGVDESGRIKFIERDGTIPGAILDKYGWRGAIIVETVGHGFFFPGFIDTHTHASQYPNAGIFGKSTLIDWLDTYTFPMEGSFSDLYKARTVYTRFVDRLLSHGTTTAAYYATIHVPATNLLADICHSKGQRAFIGRVCMDAMSPDYYRDASPSSAVEATKATIQHITKLDPTNDFITPIITPRFAPSCTTPCLFALGQLHKETNLPIQTHISENAAEIQMVKDLFPQYHSYAAVYDALGLLTSKTILAHAIHLSPSETSLIKVRNSKISHCPASNTSLTSGSLHARKLLDEGLTVSLGTDVSGGYSPSILTAARHAIFVSRHVAMSEGDTAKLTNEEVLWMATRAGAQTLGLEKKVGGFEVGMEWDAQMVVLSGVEGEAEEVIRGPVDVFGWESWEDKIAKWLYNGDDRNTVAVWVKGRRVHSTCQYRVHVESTEGR